KTTTCPGGRCADREGLPMRMAEIMAGLGGVAYSARVAVDSPGHIKRAGKAVRRAFDVQHQSRGFGFVEILSSCPTNWKMDPITANRRVAEEMIPYFPLGTFKDITEEAE
ncbi:MAG: 2-oxoglutarate oxidoreductase, partial [Desulfovibrionales bacterium]